MSPWEKAERRAALEAATAYAERSALWCHKRLRALLADRPDPNAFDLTTLRPVITTWFGERAPDVDAKDDGVTIEVARQAGTGDDRFPMDPPPGLDEDAEWFSVALLRHISRRVDEESVTSSGVGLDLWFPPTLRMQTLREHDDWDTGNLLGFDCFGRVGDDALDVFKAPIVGTIFDAFADSPPAAAVLVVNALDEDERLL